MSIDRHPVSDAVEHAPLALVVLERHEGSFRVQMASRLACEISNLPFDTIAEATAETVFPAPHIDDWLQTLDGLAPGEHETIPLMATGLAYGRRWELDDSLTTWRVSIHRLDDDHWVVFALDMTGQYRYAQLLETALQGKTQAFESMGGVVHELRQPVSSIRGFAEVLAEQTSGELGEFVSIIIEQAETLDALIDDLLTSGLTASGRTQVSADRVEGDRVAAAIRRLVSGFTDQTIDVEGELTADEVVADERRLLQVIRGLIQNAVKYGGSNITVRMSETKDRALVDVVDDGPGLDSDEVGAVFEPFSTGIKGSSVSSTGIGLGIGRSLISDMGGLLEYLEDEPGAVFRVSLPRVGGAPTKRVIEYEREQIVLLDDLMSFQTDAARRRLNRLSFDQPPSRLVEKLVRPVMYEVGERWQRGEISVAQEHHATAVVHAWLMALIARFQPREPEIVVCASAPGNEHENGLISLALALAEAGYRVVYLGRGVPVESLVKTVEETNASALFLSLSTVGDLEGLHASVAALKSHVDEGLLLGFGGRLFAAGFPAEGLPAVYLGSDPENAIRAMRRSAAA